MAASNPPVNGVAFIVYVALQDMALPGSYKAAPTLAAGDAKVSIDGGAFANLGTLPAVTPAAGVAVKITMSGAEMTGDNIFIQLIDQTNPKEWADYSFDVQTQAAATYATAAALATAQADLDNIQTRLPAALVGGRMDSDVAVIQANAMNASALAADAVTEIQSGLATSAALATVQADTDDIQTRLPAALTAGGNMKSDMLALNGGTQSAADIKDFADDGYDPATNKVQGVVLTDTVTTYTGNTPQTGDNFARLGAPAGASVSADIAAIEAQTDDIGAAGAGLTVITSKTDNLPSDPADQSLIIAATNAIVTILGAPAGASISADIAVIESQTDDIGVAGAGLTNIDLPNQAFDLVGNITGNLSGSVGSVASFGTLVADVATAVWAVAARTLTSFGTLTADVADKLLGRNLAGGSDGGRTVQDALRILRNKRSIAAGTLTVTAEDDVTPAWTATVATAVSNPVSSIDPA